MDKVNNRQTNSYTYSTTSPAFGTPVFRGHLCLGNSSVQGTQNLVPENVDMIFVFATSIEGTPLFRGKGHFLGPGDTLQLKLRLTTKIVDKLKWTLVTRTVIQHKTLQR